MEATGTFLYPSLWYYNINLSLPYSTVNLTLHDGDTVYNNYNKPFAIISNNYFSYIVYLKDVNFDKTLEVFCIDSKVFLL
jgi:hypothetical protein